MENEKSLVPIEKETALAILSSGKVDPIIEMARKIVENFVPDLSTVKGRNEIASIANKVAGFKVRIDGIGKDLVSEWKAKSKAVDQSRKKLRDELDLLKIEARKPLTVWENAEKERVENIKNRIETIKNLSHDVLVQLNNAPLEELRESMSALNIICVDSTFEEFELDAIKEHKRSIEAVEILIKNKKEELEKDAELLKLQKENEEREKIEYEEKLKRGAAEKAKLEAEEKARIEREKIEQAKQDAIEREKKAQEKAKDAKRRQIEAEERAKIEKEQAEQRRVDAEKLAKLNAEDAAEKAKQDQIEAQIEKETKEKIELERREADRAHTGKIRKGAKESLMEFVDEPTAKRIVLAIDQNRIKNVSISY